MSAHFKKKSANTKQEIPTASLPDIIFMLLIFFMVTTVLRETELLVNVSIPAAEAIEKIDQKRLIQYVYIGPEKLESGLGDPAVQIDDVAYVYGGTTSGFIESDRLYAWDLSDGSWEEVHASSTTIPTGRYKHAASVWGWTPEGTDAGFVVSGGRNNDGETVTFDDLWHFDVDASTWTEVETNLAVGDRYRHGLAWYDGAPDWMPLTQVPGVKNGGAPPPPSPPPPGAPAAEEKKEEAAPAVNPEVAAMAAKMNELPEDLKDRQIELEGDTCLYNGWVFFQKKKLKVSLY